MTTALRQRSHCHPGSPPSAVLGNSARTADMISQVASSSSPAPSKKGTSRTVAVVVFSLLFLIIGTPVIVWRSSARNNVGHSQYSYSNNNNGGKRTRRPRLAIFDSCSDPSRRKLGDAPLKVNQAPPCAYLRPALLLDPASRDPHPIAQANAAELQRTFEEINVKWRMFAFQAATNFGSSEWDDHGHGQPSLGLKQHVELDDEKADERYASLAEYIESVTILSAPKCGSRSLFQLYLSRIDMRMEMGEVDATFVEELERRQREDGVVSQKAGSFTRLVQLFQFQSSTVVPGSAMPIMRRRRDVVVSVVRDPVPRFISSVTQLLSMVRTRVCEGCREHLEPCLLLAGAGAAASSSNDLDPDQVLQCVARSITLHGFWNEHLVPWVHFVRTPLVGHDVEVAVFPMEEMGTFMEEFGVVEGMSIESIAGRGMLMQGGGERTGSEGLHFNKFDAGKSMTKQGEKLRGLVYGMQSLVSNNGLSGALREELCRLYAVDVEVMRYLGFKVGYCEG